LSIASVFRKLNLAHCIKKLLWENGLKTPDVAVRAIVDRLSTDR
jgi:hypothetical protein